MNPFRLIRQAPATVCLIWAACILFVGVYCDTTDAPNSRNEALRKWGAVLPLIMISADSQHSHFEEVAGSSGPMEIWNGQWWRLLVDNLHHGGPIHLLLNGCAMFYLGRIIERRMSSFLYLLMLIGAAFAVAAASGLTAELGIGLSGVAYAQVGLLMVWRDRDESVAEEFTFGMVVFAGMWLLFCQVITYADIYPIGNVGHYTGLIYGWMWGQVYLEEQKKVIFRFLFGVSHLLLYPAFWFIVHPFWLGSWHYYQSQKLDLLHGKLIRSLEAATGEERHQIERQLARVEEEQESENWQRRKVERLQTALLREPALEAGWVEISQIYERRGERTLALWTALEGLKFNRSSEKLLNRSVDLWVTDELDSQDSEASNRLATNLVERVFEEEAGNWKEKLSVRVEHQRNRLSWQPDELAQLMGVPQLFSLPEDLDQLTRQREALPNTLHEAPDVDLPPKVPEFDPSWPDSAREGALF